MAYTTEQIRLFLEAREQGFSIERAAKVAKISYSGAREWMKRGSNFTVAEGAIHRKNLALRAPREIKEFSPEATRALTDFTYFQRRYFGRLPAPWQAEAAARIVEYLESEEEEYVVINAPPGSGKSTVFTLDIPAWLTCRNRRIRGLIGSATATQSTWYLRRLRRALERTEPERGEVALVEKGLAFDAECTLAADFGRFRPATDQDVWSKESIVVLQADGSSITEKEATWSAFGRDQEFLGGRYDFVIWDDLVVPKRLRTIDLIEADQRWFDEYAETRLEPGGMLVLQGQRMGVSDLYRYALDKVAAPDDDDEEETPLLDVVEADATRSNRKYHHIIFKAHYDEACGGPEFHKKNSPPYPEGCLLVPSRLGYRKLNTIRANARERFEVVYQQQDVDAAGVLVNPAWITGGGGNPGCWDLERDRLEIPKGLDGPLLSVLSCDPSPTRYWAIEWWCYHANSEQRFLVDIERQAMDAPDFLDWDYNNHTFTGLLEEWWQTSVHLGVPITHVIVEINAAQRFLLQYDHVRRWQSLRSVQIIPHSTHRNKSDEDYGVQSIAPHYQHGRIRLPGKGKGRRQAKFLVDEVTRYPHNTTDDCIMAHWFFEWQLPQIVKPEPKGSPPWRPSWMRNKAKTGAERFMAERVRVPA